MHLADTAKALIVFIALSSANSAHAIDPVELTKLTPSTQTADQRFGAGVSVSGDTIVVGNEGAENADGADTGSVLVFTRDQDNITLQAELFPSDGLPDYRFGRSVVIQGDTILVGVENADQNNGAVYVYVRNNGLWTEQAKLTVASTGSTMSFGHAVDLDGDTAIISAAPFDPQLGNEITAYVFVRSNGIWTEQQQLILPERSTANMGSDVAVSGDTILLSAPEISPTGWQVGAFYVYVRQGNSWTIQAKVISPDRPGSYADDFGLSLDLEGDTAVAGNLGIIGQGAVYVFERDQGVWSFSSRMEASDGFSNDLFSNSLELSGDVIVAGAYNQTQNGNSAGAAYVFVRENGTWAENAILLASDGDSLDRFGSAVAIDGSTIIVAAVTDENGGSLNNPSGSAYVFALPTPSPEFSVAPETVTFGATNVDDISYQTLTVQNLAQYAITVTASSNAPFSILSGSSYPLEIGESAIIDLAFSPSTPGLQNGLLDVSTLAQNVAVELVGEGLVATHPAIALSAANLNFGSIDIGDASASSEVTVTNVGDANLLISSIDLSGDFADFMIDASTCALANIPPAGTCSFLVQFLPLAEGPRSAIATILSNATNGSAQLDLLGTGLETMPSVCAPSIPPNPDFISADNSDSLGLFEGSLTDVSTLGPTRVLYRIDPTNIVPTLLKGKRPLDLWFSIKTIVPSDVEAVVTPGTCGPVGSLSAVDGIIPPGAHACYIADFCSTGTVEFRLVFDARAAAATFTVPILEELLGTIGAENALNIAFGLLDVPLYQSAMDHYTKAWYEDSLSGVRDELKLAARDIQALLKSEEQLAQVVTVFTSEGLDVTKSYLLKRLKTAVKYFNQLERIVDLVVVNAAGQEPTVRIVAPL